MGDADIEVDGSTVEIDDTTIVLSDEDGAPLALTEASPTDGYVVYRLPSGDKVTLRFFGEGDSDE